MDRFPVWAVKPGQEDFRSEVPHGEQRLPHGRQSEMRCQFNVIKTYEGDVLRASQTDVGKGGECAGGLDIT